MFTHLQQQAINYVEGFLKGALVATSLSEPTVGRGITPEHWSVLSPYNREISTYVAPWIKPEERTTR